MSMMLLGLYTKPQNAGGFLRKKGLYNFAKAWALENPELATLPWEELKLQTRFS